MGTRHLICVYHKGEYKVAQYGQWDGYPSGQGLTALSFLKQPGNIEKLRAALHKVRFLEPAGRDKELIASYEANAPEWSSQPDNRTDEQKRWFSTYISRDIGANILKNIAFSEENEIVLRNSIDFAGDSAFCEYAYVVDLDKYQFEIYKGFNHQPLDESERFASIKCERSDYRQVKFLASFSLNSLPPDGQEFLRACGEIDEAEEAVQA